MKKINVLGLRYNKERIPSIYTEYTVKAKLKNKIYTPKEAYEILNYLFHTNTKIEEYVYLICLDGANKVIGIFVVSQGTNCQAYINIHGILLRALLTNAVSIIIAHNHPSGECNISNDDMMVFHQMKKACLLMDITLADNLIIGNGKYLSFKEENMMDEMFTCGNI